MPAPAGPERVAGPQGTRLRGALLAAMLVAALLGGLWLARAPVAAWTIATLAYAHGHEPLRLTIGSVEFGRLRATDVRYGEAFVADAVEAEFTFGGLVSGHVARLSVDGLRLALQFGPDGVALVGVPAATADARPWPLPFDTLEVRGVDAALRSGAGDAMWRGNLRLQPAEAGGHAVTLVGMLTTPRGDAAFDAVGTVTSNPLLGRGLALAISAGAQTPDGGFGLSGRLQALMAGNTLGARFEFERAWATAGENKLAGLGGRVELSTGRGGLKRLSVTAGYDSIGAEGIALAPGRVALSYEAGALDARIELGWGKSRARVTARGRVDDLDAPLLLEAEAALLAGDALAFAGLDGQAGGRIEFRLAGALSDPRALLETLTARAALERLRGRLELALAVEHATLARIGAGLDLTGRLVATIDDTGLRLTTGDGLIAAVEALDGALLAHVPERLRPALAGQQVLTVGGAEDRPTTFTWRRAGDAHDLALDGTARFRGRFANLDCEASARVILDGSLQPQKIDIASVSLAVNEIEFGPAGLAGELRVTGFTGTGSVARGQMSLDGMLADLAEPGITLDEANLALDGELTWRQGRLEFAPTPGGRLALRGIGWEDQLHLPEPIELQLAVGANALSFTPASGELRYVVSLAPFHLAGQALMPDGAPAGLALAVPVATLHGGSIGEHSLLLRAARLELARPEWRAFGIDIDFDWNAKAGRLVAAAKELRDAASVPFLAPLSLRAEAHLSDGRFSYTAQLTAADGRASGAADGIVDLAAGRGDARFSLGPLNFRPDGLQPAQVFPAHGAALHDAAGRIELTGGMRWGGGAAEARARVTLRDLSVSAGEVRLTELNGPIEFVTVAPLVTAPAQRVSGVAMLDGRGPASFDLTFHVPETGVPEVERLAVAVADGTLMTEPFMLDPDDMDFDAAFLDLDLAELAVRLGVEGLLTDARMSGRASVRIGRGALTIADGELISIEPGFLRYGGTAIAAQYHHQPETVTQMMQALDGFEFGTLRLGITKPSSGAGTLRAEIAGVNPAVLDGQPFELELVLRSDYAPLEAMAEAIRAAAAGFRSWVQGSSKP